MNPHRIQDVDTPALLCDLNVLERNIEDMAAHCRALEIPLRVHTKSHKIPEIAHSQLASGAIGITCQKVGEAEVMVEAGIKDILIPYNIVGMSKVERLLRLARRATMTVAVDSLTTAQGISQEAAQTGSKVHIVIELDTTGWRCGVQSPQAALELARQVEHLPGLVFEGVMTFPSRPQAEPFLSETLALFQESGIPVNMISGGGTGAEAASKEIGCTETRSGSYIWEGMTRVQSRDHLDPGRCPLRMVTTVVSTPAPGRAIIDAGMKSFTSYPPIPYGYCIEDPDVKIMGMSVEHGHLDVTESDRTLQVGDRLSFIPLHGGMTLNLHDELVGVRGNFVEVIWPVAGRGRSR